MLYFKRFFLCLMAPLCFGCAMAYGPSFNLTLPAAGKSMIYVYRAPSISGFAMSAMPVIFVDGIKYRNIKNGGYVAIDLEPGHHQVLLRNTFFGKVLNSNSGSIDFEIEAGEVKYFEYAQITVGYNTYGDTQVADVRTHFLQVPSSYARKKLKKTRQLKYNTQK